MRFRKLVVGGGVVCAQRWREGYVSVRGKTLDGEWSGHSNPRSVNNGPIQEQLESGVSAYCLLDLTRTHFGSDIWILGDRLKRDVFHSLVDESL